MTKTATWISIPTTYPGGIKASVLIDHKAETVQVNCSDRDGAWVKRFDWLEECADWLRRIASGPVQTHRTVIY